MQTYPISFSLARAQERGQGLLSTVTWQWRPWAFCCQLYSRFWELVYPTPGLWFLISTSQGLMLAVEYRVREMHAPLFAVALFTHLHKGKALSALSREQLMHFLVLPQNVLALFQFLRIMGTLTSTAFNGLDVYISIYIYESAKQSVSFMESITLCAGLWSFNCVHNSGRCIWHRSTYSIHLG